MQFDNYQLERTRPMWLAALAIFLLDLALRRIDFSMIFGRQLSSLS
jgi:hypothetical protein